jgi:uncharacterized Tic20 family protein
MSATIQFQCSVCKATLSRRRYLIGTRTECSECRHWLQVPEPDPTAIQAVALAAPSKGHSSAICREPFRSLLLSDGIGLRSGAREDRFSERARDLRKWAMLIHLAHLLNFVLPAGGFAVQLFIWQFKQDDHPEIDLHGRNAINWTLSSVVVLLPMVPFVGLPLLALTFIFPIWAALKADQGVIWSYPLSIEFLS